MTTEISPDVETMVRHARGMAMWKIASRKRRDTVPKGVIYEYSGPESEPDGEMEEKSDEQPAFSVPELDRLFANTDREVRQLMKAYRL